MKQNQIKMNKNKPISKSEVEAFPLGFNLTSQFPNRRARRFKAPKVENCRSPRKSILFGKVQRVVQIINNPLDGRKKIVHYLSLIK